MARRFNLIFLLSLTLLSIFGTTSFANITMTEEIADGILDYFSENLSVIYAAKGNFNNATFDSGKEILKNFDRTNFTNNFNQNFNTTLNYNEYYSFQNITVMASGINTEKVDLYFILSNNTAGTNNLDFMFLRNNGSNTLFQLRGIDNKDSNLTAVKIEITDKNEMTFLKTSINGNIRGLAELPINIGESKIYTNFLLALSQTQVVYYTPNYQSTSDLTYFLGNYIDAVPSTPIPPTPSGDTGESGDTGGGTGGDTGGGTTTPDYSEDLDNIQTGITDINNNIGETNNKLDNISGELSNINNNLTTVPDISDTTITNDDITNNLDFEFEEDPYTNFWLELTTGLGNAFTNNKREINIQFRDKTHIISLDNFSIQIPSALKPFLTIISTVFITWKMLQYIKIIIDNISSGNIDEVLEMNEEEGITNLF